jgi:hypothetical protein
MVLGCFRKKAVFAGFAAEAQAPMMVTDKTKLSTTVCAAVLQLGHEALPPIWRLLALRLRLSERERWNRANSAVSSDFDRISVLGSPATRHGVGLPVQIMQDGLLRDFD